MNVLIADDINSVHIFLEKRIDWEGLGINSILHAYNGLECIDIVNKELPDILILDIKMPVMNGIEALNHISESNFMPKTIILSAYDEFNFAQAALRHGAIDYILKPIDENNVTAIIKKIVQSLQTYYYTILRNHLIDAYFGERILNIATILTHLNVTHDYFCILVKLLDNTDHFNGIADKLKEICHLSFKLTPESMFFVCNSAPDNYSAQVDRIKQICEPIGSKVCIGISSLADIDDNNLREIYDQCIDALNTRFCSEGNVFIYKALSSSIEFDTGKIRMYKEQIVKSILDSYKPIKLNTIIDDLFLNLSASMPTHKAALDICYNILYHVVHYLFFSGNLKETHDTSDLGKKLLDELSSFDNIDAMKEGFKRIILEYIVPDSDPNENVPWIMNHVKHFLHTNYSSNISLESISKEFFISKYELCRKFKQFEGENIWDYLKKIRMEKAKEILANTDIKIYEIAEKVGYNDPTYFSNVFKKHFGCSPHQFRNA